MNKLNDLKARMQSDADKLTDPDVRNRLYGQINDINKLQSDFMKNRGEITVPTYEGTNQSPVNPPQGAPQGGNQGQPNPQDGGAETANDMQSLGQRMREINDYNRGRDVQ